MKIHLESDMLALRASTFDDCRLFEQWEAKEYVNRFFTMNHDRDYEEITREFVIRDEDLDKAQMTIISKPASKPIGRIYLSRFDRHEDSIDITRIYIGEEDYLGKGLGREALRLLLEYFFNELKLERVTIDFFEDNFKAENLYKSLGFKSEGVMRHVAKKNSTYINLHLMSILRNEYEAK